MTWLPTTTPPAPGQRILIISGKGVIHLARFDENKFILDYSPYSLFRPRWWMPLPEPPQ